MKHINKTPIMSDKSDNISDKSLHGGELKPCPFCGGKAEANVGLSAFEDVEISCRSCASSGPNCDDGFSRTDNLRLATTQWNTRTTDRQADDAQTVEGGSNDRR